MMSYSKSGRLTCHRDSLLSFSPNRLKKDLMLFSITACCFRLSPHNELDVDAPPEQVSVSSSGLECTFSKELHGARVVCIGS